MSQRFRSTLRATILIATLSAGPLFSFAQKAPAPGTYLVPQGWTVQNNAESVTISSPGRRAQMFLTVYEDKREATQVCSDFIASQTGEKSKQVEITTRKIFTYASKDVAKIELQLKQKGHPTQREWVVGVPMERGTLLLAATMAAADSYKYLPVMDRIVVSVLPKLQAPISPYKVSDPDVGLKLMAAANWLLLPETKRGGVAYINISKDDALLSLSSRQNKLGTKQYLASLEAKTRSESKSYEKISEQQQKIAGIDGTRLELRTTNPQGVTTRQWLFVFSNEGRHYLVAASAPEKEFDKNVPDFNFMIRSIALDK